MPVAVFPPVSSTVQDSDTALPPVPHWAQEKGSWRGAQENTSDSFQSGMNGNPCQEQLVPIHCDSEHSHISEHRDMEKVNPNLYK